MGIGRVIGAAAPIAAGYFGGPALAGAFGSATGGAIAAGALTGAGIAALSGQDVLGGAVTGGLGGLSGGAMGTAAQATKAAEAAKLAQAGAPTSQINASLYATSPFTSPSVNPTTLAFQEGKAFLPSGYTAPSAITGPQPLAQSIQAGQGPNMGFRSLSTDVAGGGGYQSIGDTFAQGIESGQAAFREPGEFLSQLGKGSKAMGAGRLGLTGLGVAGQAGAFDVEPVDIGPRPEERYDPNRRLDLSMDTGIDQALRRDTGLRLLAGGGKVQKYANGGETALNLNTGRQEPLNNVFVTSTRPYKLNADQLINLAEKGVKLQTSKGVIDVGNQMADLFRKMDNKTTAEKNQQGSKVQKFNMGGLYGITPAAPPPKYGIIDVGGKFVETSDKPGPGLISDADFKEQYQTTTAEKNQQGGGGGGMDPNLAPGGQGADDKGMSSGALSALASGFAQQQMNPPTKSQTLGLEALAGGGYLETGGEVGDGMSDEIEATIEGTQEARLSDGEFVIPADVVSHLGNGSSDAGARRLYEMMDKVRMARTGTKKQGKEINPERYMPR